MLIIKIKRSLKYYDSCQHCSRKSQFRLLDSQHENWVQKKITISVQDRKNYTFVRENYNRERFAKRHNYMKNY